MLLMARKYGKAQLDIGSILHLQSQTVKYTWAPKTTAFIASTLQRVQRNGVMQLKTLLILLQPYPTVSSTLVQMTVTSTLLLYPIPVVDTLALQSTNSLPLTVIAFDLIACSILAIIIFSNLTFCSLK